MRIYSADDEQRVRMQAQVSAWLGAGLIDAAQSERLRADLHTELRRTNVWLRMVIGFFTLLIVGGFVALTFISLEIRGDVESGLTLALIAVLCLVAAEYLAGGKRLYRFGAEEVFAGAASALAAFATGSFIGWNYDARRHLNVILAMLVASAGFFAVYRRFGFIYAGVVALACAALLPFEFDISNSAARIIAAGVFATAFAVARAKCRAAGDDFPADEYASLEAAACAGAYLSVNLVALDPARWFFYGPAAASGGVFYWATFALIWLIPAATLYDAIRVKDRSTLTAGLALALVTFATNKPYLGLARQTWDPMILAVVLIGAVVGVRRWLARGDDGQRNGYTAEPILRTGDHVLIAVANASVAWHDRLQAPPRTEPQPTGFDQGRSGGGGGGATF